MSYGVKTPTGKTVVNSINEIDFIDSYAVLAEHVANSLFGQGITVHSDNDQVKKFLKDMIKKNQLDDYLLQIARENSLYGSIVFVWDKYADGSLRLSHATPELLQIVERIEINEVAAKLMFKKVYGQRVFFETVTYTTTHIYRSVQIQDSKTQVARDFEFGDNKDGEFPAELIKPAEEFHGLGFVPIEMITNKAARNTVTGTAGNALGFDKLADAHNGRHLHIQINNVLRQHYKEAILGKSKAFMSLSKAEKARISAEQGLDGTIVNNDYMYDTDMAPNASKAVETVAGTYDGLKWLNAVKALVNIFFDTCGYSMPYPEATEQTEAETLLSKDKDQKSTKTKRRRYTEFLNSMFAKGIVYEGLANTIEDAEELFTVEIKESVVYNKLQLTSFLLEQVTGGLMSQLEAIMLQRDIDDKEEAQTILETIHKENMEYAEKARKELEASLPAQELGGEPGEPGEDNNNMGAMGANTTKDADPRAKTEE